MTFHSLRKTWASRMGPHTPVRILQILGGWSSLKMVEDYCQPHEESLREAMEKGAQSGVPKSVEQVSDDHGPVTIKALQLLKRKENGPVAQLDRAAVS
ncbi:MAG: tyrosine-type recombinase/integrase [Nitrospiraceae bacterium]